MRQLFAVTLVAASLVISSCSAALADDETAKTTIPEAASIPTGSNDAQSTTLGSPHDESSSSEDKTANKTTDNKKKAKTKFPKLTSLRSNKKALAEAKTGKSGDEKDGDANKASSSKSSTKKSSSVNFPERFASALVGTIVGTPINIVKKSISETVVATKDIVGDTNNWFLLAPAGAFSVPAGVLSGTMQAPIVSGYRAWKHSATDPFGSDSMSLGSDK